MTANEICLFSAMCRIGGMADEALKWHDAEGINPMGAFRVIEMIGDCAKDAIEKSKENKESEKE